MSSEKAALAVLWACWLVYAASTLYAFIVAAFGV